VTTLVITLLYMILSHYQYFSQLCNLSDMLTVLLAVEKFVLGGGLGSDISVSARGRASQLNYISDSF